MGEKPMIPTVKTMVKRGIDRDKAILIRRVMEAKTFLQVNNIIHTKHGYENFLEYKLEAINNIMNGFGIECLRDEDQNLDYWYDVRVLYVNTGDSYKTTILYDTLEHKYIVTSWGEWYERATDKGMNASQTNWE